MAFDEVKATQTAAAFLRLSGGQLQYLALIKLLYKLDREAIRRWGVPVTTDKYASLRFGPVVSRIYNLIKASGDQNSAPSYWTNYIRKPQPYDVALVNDPGTSELSRAEKALIREVFEADGSKDGFALADECHREFPEWKDPGKSSKPIEISDILDALGASEDEAAHTESSVNAQRAVRRLAR